MLHGERNHAAGYHRLSKSDFVSDKEPIGRRIVEVESAKHVISGPALKVPEPV
jgi:hypothetical protein